MQCSSPITPLWFTERPSLGRALQQHGRSPPVLKCVSYRALSQSQTTVNTERVDTPALTTKYFALQISFSCPTVPANVDIVLKCSITELVHLIYTSFKYSALQQQDPAVHQSRKGLSVCHQQLTPAYPSAGPHNKPPNFKNGSSLTSQQRKASSPKDP